MKTPFFSIIIPTLNEEEYIGRLLRCLARQHEKHFEVFVVDARSSDKTKAVVESFRNKLPLKFLESSKKNVSLQRNMGAAKAHGKYLVFFDADIQIPTNFLDQLELQILKNSGDFYSTYVRTDSRHVYDKAIAMSMNLGLEVSLLIEKPFVLGFNFIVSQKVFKRAGGFRKDLVHAEDIDLSMRLQKAGYLLQIIHTPQLICSLRRYQAEGRLEVIRKHTISTLHLVTKGPITQALFHYPMGGGWYRKVQQEKLKPDWNEKAELFLKQLKQAFIE